MLLLTDRPGGRAPGPVDDEDLVELYRWPDDGPRLRSNFVASLDGSITGPDERSGSLGTPGDAYVFALHRALADAVVVAAGTLRAEGMRAVDLQPWQIALRTRLGLAAFPLLVVVTASGRVDPAVARPASGAGGPVLVVAAAGAPSDRVDALRAAGVEVAQDGADQVDLAGLVDRLAGRGLTRLLCEGGPRLHRDLLAAGLVDELSLTLAPQVVGGDGPRTTSGPALPSPAGFTLATALLDDDGALLTRYVRR